MKQSKQVALAGMFAAMQIVFLFLGSTIWVLCYIAPLYCGLAMIILKESAGARYCVLSYIVSSVFGMFFLPDKECVLLYALFFGYYTIIRQYFDRLPKWLSVLLKYLLFNASLAATEALLYLVLRIPLDNSLGRYGIPLLFVLFNIMFFIYEKLFSRLTVLYNVKYKNRVDRLLK